MTTWPQAFDYLQSRGNHHDLSVPDLLAATPSSIQSDPSAIVEFWQHKDISHILPVSTHPELANDPTNIFPEDPSINRARQDEPVTPLERLEAWIDNQFDAIKASLHLPL